MNLPGCPESPVPDQPGEDVCEQGLLRASSRLSGSGGERVDSPADSLHSDDPRAIAVPRMIARGDHAATDGPASVIRLTAY